MVTALLHAVHALSLPVRMGVDYVSQSQWFYWSCQHSICALESGVFVWQWLHSIEDDAGQSEITSKCALATRLSPPAKVSQAAEKRILCWIRALVREALESVDRGDLGLSKENIEHASASRLGSAVLLIWSRVLSGNAMWPVIGHISNACALLAKCDPIPS